MLKQKIPCSGGLRWVTDQLSLEPSQIGRWELGLREGLRHDVVLGALRQRIVQVLEAWRQVVSEARGGAAVSKPTSGPVALREPV